MLPLCLFSDGNCMPIHLSCQLTDWFKDDDRVSNYNWLENIRATFEYSFLCSIFDFLRIVTIVTKFFWHGIGHWKMFNPKIGNDYHERFSKCHLLDSREWTILLKGNLVSASWLVTSHRSLMPRRAAAAVAHAQSNTMMISPSWNWLNKRTTITPRWNRLDGLSPRWLNKKSDVRNN